MKVAILGAGPAGLYLAILLAKASPANEIEVIERNAADATFGWGVVFSEETLGALRDADHQTYVEITDTFARWDTVDIRYRGRLLRSRGHAFSAIARKLLLEILQRRCRDLGVELRFGVEVSDPAALRADLVVGADGVNSLVRAADPSSFGATVAPEGCRFAWFGTDLVFDAFTFIFRETEHGLFQVHAYPFDERLSTFIVECPEAVWRRAGPDTMSESESIAFCEELFAPDLAGHRLLSNRSLWTSFMKVRCSAWHRGNVVLVGDAAHTAHFTIGSGTKLAMEDAIALAGALAVRGDDLEAAFVDYELERQPVVERFQEAASDSAAWFERLSRVVHLEPMQFAFNLLTRSGRISHTGLARRDPGFVRVLDSWFAGAGATGIAAPPMFAPLEVGGLTLANRVVGRVGPFNHHYDGEKGPRSPSGGAALVLTDFVALGADGRISPDTPVLDSDETVAKWSAIAADVHAAGAHLALSLGHAGRRGATRPRAEGVDVPLRDGPNVPGRPADDAPLAEVPWPLVSASAIPYGPFSATPRAMDANDMARVRDEFASAAGRAADAGVDVLELNFAHGYLVASFLSPLTNQREDDYGGQLENRLRFPLDVLEAVRSAWSSDRLLAVRLSVTDWARGGVTVDDGIEIARALAAGGAQLVHVVAGQTVIGGRPEYRRGFLTTLSERVRTEARVPTLVGGWLETPDEANTIIAAGRADLCILELPRTGLEDQVEAEMTESREAAVAP